MNAHQIETEAKYLIESTQELEKIFAILRSYSYKIIQIEKVHIQDQYFDTAQWAFFQNGWAYRWQFSQDRLIAGLKSLDSSDSAIQKRQEIEIELAHKPEALSQLPDGEFANKIRDIQKQNQLIQLFSIDKKRTKYLITLDETQFELAYDHVDTDIPYLPMNQKSEDTSYKEVEIELKKGRYKHLLNLTHILENQLTLEISWLNKFERGLQSTNQKPPSLKH